MGGGGGVMTNLVPFLFICLFAGSQELGAYFSILGHKQGTLWMDGQSITGLIHTCKLHTERSPGCGILRTFLIWDKSTCNVIM